MPRRERPPSPRAEAAAGCACAHLRRAARLVTQLYDGALRPSGLRATQFTLLMATHHLEPAPLTRLARIVAMDRTTLTRNLEPLEAQALIRTRTGGDRRVREVSLTDRGRDALARALPLWERAQARVTRRLGPTRLARLLEDLWAVGAVAGST